MKSHPAELPRVLLVEDDAELGAVVAEALTAEGFDLEWVTDGPAALVGAAATAPAVALLDVGLPGMSGFELCRRLRAEHPLLHILMLTARDAVEDRVRGLDAGADDYVVKPFALSELAARLRAALRKGERAQPGRARVAGLDVDLASHSVSVDGRTVALSPKEASLLHLFVSRAGRTLSRPEILDEVWDTQEHIDPNVVDQYVSYLRRKLAPWPGGVQLNTVRGVGFVLGEA